MTVVPSDPTTGIVTTRRFDADDQLRFAASSGDRNPMHVDAVAARRLLTGRQVVHGMHAALWTLEHWPHAWPDVDWRIDIDFLNPISIGDIVALRIDEAAADPHERVAVLDADGLKTCRVGVSTATTAAAAPAGALEIGLEVFDIADPRAVPLERDPASWRGTRQRIALAPIGFDADFPAACARLGERRVAALAVLSSYVGMICPGLHSVFASAQLAAGDERRTDMTFEVRRFDPRFGHFVVAFDGPVRGELKAFVRPPPQPQPSTTELASAVAGLNLRGTRHLIVGGSRGLGELTAKLVSAAGAQATLTYQTGAADAGRVADDIGRANGPTPTCVAFDLLHDEPDAWLATVPLPDAVWYFATPRIFRKRVGLFNVALFDEFVHVYATRFAALCEALQRRSGGREIAVFQPSTVFVDERPPGMTEYAMAKAAAETLVDDLRRACPNLRFVVARLPRLATDQTATMAARAVAPTANVDVMLPLIRRMAKASA